jgi:hypothetical protein
MSKYFRRAMVGVGLIVLLAACQNLGTKLIFNGAELYYTPRVTSAEAAKLGAYLVDHKFTDGTRKTLQLDKQGGVYQFRMVAEKPGIERDKTYGEIFQWLGLDLSERVFGDAKVELHICDQGMKTLRIFPQRVLGKKVMVNKSKIYYTSTVTAQEAQKLSDFLLKNGYNGDEPVIYQLNKKGATYEFLLSVKKGLDQDPKVISMMKNLAKAMSKQVFHGAEVDIHLCDEFLHTIRVVIVI